MSLVLGEFVDSGRGLMFAVECVNCHKLIGYADMAELLQMTTGNIEPAICFDCEEWAADLEGVPSGSREKVVVVWPIGPEVSLSAVLGNPGACGGSL